MFYIHNLSKICNNFELLTSIFHSSWQNWMPEKLDDTNTVTTGQLMYSDATWGRGARRTQDDTNTVTTGQLMYSDATWGWGARPTQDDTNTVTTGQLMYSDATWGRGARPTQDDTNTVTTGQLMYSDATWGRGARPTQDDTNTVTTGQLMYSDATWGRGARPVSGPGTSCRSRLAHTGWFGGVPAAATRSAGWSSSESSTRTPASPRSSAWCLQTHGMAWLRAYTDIHGVK